MENELITVGILGRPHGVRGQIKCHPETHDLNRHKLLKKVFVTVGSETQEHTLEKSSLAGKDWLLKFVGIDTPEAVAALTNGDMQIPVEERLPLPDGEYYFSDFPGFKVIDETGKAIGVVVDCMQLPSVKAFSVQFNTAGEVLVPWVDDCVKAIDDNAKTITCSSEFIESLLANATGNDEEEGEKNN